MSSLFLLTSLKLSSIIPIMKLVDKAKLNSVTLQLTETVEVSQIENKEIQAEIIGFYNEGTTKAMKLIGTVINACSTGNKPAFMFSRSLLYGLIRQDINLEKGLELFPRDYKELLMYMIKHDLFECLNKPSLRKKGMSHNVAGLYRVKHPALRKHFIDIEVQELKIIKEYCEYQNIPLIKITY